MVNSINYPKAQTEKIYAHCPYMPGRWGRFTDLVKQLFETRGSALLENKYRRKWTKLFTNERRSLKISRVVAGETIPVKRVLDVVQYELDNNRIKLNAENPADQLQKNGVRWDQVQAYLKEQNCNPKLRTFWEKGGVDVITLEELKLHLPACASFADSQIKGSYKIGFVPQKSSRWIAEQALPYMQSAPEQSFRHATDTGSSQSPVVGRRFVIFDDASYSGLQCVHIISNFVDHAKLTCRDPKLYVVIPFMSEAAIHIIKRQLANFVSDPDLPEGLKIHLITSCRSIKSIQDIFPEDPPNSRSITEWKVPDQHSIPTGYLSGVTIHADRSFTKYSFVTNHFPCYKASKE